MANVILLGEVAARLPMLEVSCNRCPRIGRLSTTRLLAEHGPAMPMPALRRLVAADCPRMGATQITEACGARFPGLPAVFISGSPSSDET